MRDTKGGRRLEDGLQPFLVRLINDLGVSRIRRRQEAEAERIRQQQAAELKRRRDELAARQEAERKRVDELFRHFEAWHRSRQLREYLYAAADMVIARDGAIPINGKTADYLRWAHGQADRMDPLKDGPHSVLDERA